LLRRVSFVVWDKPTPLARPRFRIQPGGKVHTYTVRRDQEARIAIRDAWLREASEPLLGAIRLTVTALIAMPLSIPKKRRIFALPTKRPDLDNYIKQVEDALLGYAYKDDAQIVSIMARKRYQTDGEPPCWLISIEEIGDQE
jgi:Holliday junction resolvase RusA-like endonuclease